MQKRKADYEDLLASLLQTLKHSPEELSNALDKSVEVLQAANELTKDEIALVSAYVKADLKSFAQEYEESRSGSFYLTISNSIWQGLLDITDKTKLEWMELSQELEHQGVYHTGEVIGLGSLVCENCGNKTQYTHPTIIEPCYQCGGEAFSRVALTP